MSAKTEGILDVSLESSSSSEEETNFKSESKIEVLQDDALYSQIKCENALFIFSK